MSKKKVLVAGGSGFLGRHLLLNAPEDWRITAMYNSSRRFPAFVKAHGLANVTPAKCDLRKRADVERVAKKHGRTFDLCFFLMGNSDIGLSLREPQTDLAANIHTLLNLIETVKIGKLVFMSSGTVYLGQSGPVGPGTETTPAVPYGITKLASELYIRTYAEKTDRIGEYVILRFFGAYGPMEPERKIYTNLIKSIAIEGANKYTLRGDGKNYIDAMYVDDAAEGLIQVALSDKANVTVDFCRGTPQTINELVMDVARILGADDFTLRHEGGSAEYITFYASPQKMQRLFGFAPRISLKDGILEFKKHLAKGK